MVRLASRLRTVVLIGALLPSVAAAQQRRAENPPMDSLTAARVRAEQREDPNPAPARAEGEGPFSRLIIRGVNIIDGYGSAPRG